MNACQEKIAMHAQYNRANDIFMVTLSDSPIDDAEECGPFIFHYDKAGRWSLKRQLESHSCRRSPGLNIMFSGTEHFS